MSKRRLKASANGDFELRHWRSTKRRTTRPSTLKIPNGDKTSSEFSEIDPVLNENDDEGYISLRDILTSPEYADVSSPVRGGSWPEINIRNPLVKHAAYAYLQPTPSAREAARRRQVMGPFRFSLCSCSCSAKRFHNCSINCRVVKGFRFFVPRLFDQ